jgi:hypothetical protein
MEPILDPDDEGSMEGGPYIDIPPLGEDGERDFMDQRKLFDDLSNIAGIDNKRFEHLVETKLQQYSNHKNKEEFCKSATPGEVAALIAAV